MIGSTISRMAMAEKLSIPQLQQAIKAGTIPAYIGVPMIQERMKREQEAKMAQQAQGQQQPPVADQVMAQAEQQGLETLPSNFAPEGMAGGGIVAFADGGLPDDKEEDDELEELFPSGATSEADLISLIGRSGAGGQSAGTVSRESSKGVNLSGVKAPKNGSTFDKALAFIFPHEGGYVNDPVDRGGATNKGITQNTLSGYLGRKASIEDVKGITPELARDIYKSKYWDAIGGDKLDPKIAMLAFDTAVGSGVGKAKQMLAKYGDDPEKFLSAKKQFLYDIAENDPSQKRFIRGWQNRMNNLGGYIQQLSGGGIASLAQGGEVKHFKEGDPVTDQELADFDKAQQLWEQGRTDEDAAKRYMNRVEAVRSLPSDIGGFVSNRLVSMANPFKDAYDLVKGASQTSPEEQRLNWQIGKDIREGKRGMFDTEQDIQRDKESIRKAQQEVKNTETKGTSTTPFTGNLRSWEQKNRGGQDYFGLDKPFGKQVPPVLGGGKDTTKDVVTGGDKKETVEDTTKAGITGLQDDYVTKFRERLAAQMEEARAEGDQNKYLALLQAGLGIMGGTSRHAAANIGAGGAQGVQTYAALQQAAKKNLRDIQAQELGLYKYEQAAKNAFEQRKLMESLRRDAQKDTSTQRAEDRALRERELDFRQQEADAKRLENTYNSAQKRAIDILKLDTTALMDADNQAKVNALTNSFLKQNKQYLDLYKKINQEDFYGGSNATIPKDVLDIINKYKK